MMRSKKPKTTAPGVSRREFLLTVGATPPAVSLMKGETGGAPQAAPASGAHGAHEKFTPVDLSGHFNSSALEFRRRKNATRDSDPEALLHVPGGKRDLQGIPFALGPEDSRSKSWIVLSTKSGDTAAQQVEIPLGQKAHFLCIASFSDFDDRESPEPGQDAFQKVGQRLADVTLVYEDKGTHTLPIRRRFETNEVSTPWRALLTFAALPPGKIRTTQLTDPLLKGTEWGDLQTSLAGNGSLGPGLGFVWICAIENPEPDRSLRAVRMEAAGEDSLVVCGLTLYHRSEYPLRFESRALYRITLPEAAAENAVRWQVDVDLGTVGRTFALPNFNPQAWLAASAAGLGEPAAVSPHTRHLYAEIIANANATMTLRDSRTGKRYSFELANAIPGKELPGTEGSGSIEIVEPGRRWIHCRVLDPDTQRPTPVRLAFRSKEGRYIPPYGHRAEINDTVFQEIGADVKMMGTSFAYVDGAFQVELPVGEVYLEMTKGFEREAVRRKIDILPGQSELTVEIPRFTNLRTQGWVTADMHVHCMCPTTAMLEAQAEGLNLVNLLALQLGGLFTNVGDLSYGPLVSADGDSMVWLGSENRQRVLGHISLEGMKGNPVFPMAADGPSEAYLGDPLWSSLAEWADACHERQGLVVAPHFPYPTGEIAADIVLGKIDAVEIWSRDDPRARSEAFEEFNSLHYLDWYHYLNCGYRLPVVGGTDKMAASVPVGATRVYTYLGQQEFNYPNFARAVRAGNTFVTSGPLLLFHAEGRPPGGEITLGADGATVEVTADAQCFVPIHRLEVVFNGKVIASKDEPAGARKIQLKEQVKVQGPGWLAARCSSQCGPTTRFLFKIAAHTSPVYIRVPGKELFSQEAANYFLQLIEGARMYVEKLATRPDAETFARVRKVFTDARAELQQRMSRHGLPPINTITRPG